jgi:glc operon protein GlcG
MGLKGLSTMICHPNGLPAGQSARRSLALWGAILVISTSWSVAARAQDAEKPIPLASEIRDAAGIFGVKEVEAALRRLRELEAALGVATIVESVDSLRGKSVDDVAVDLARRSATHGVFVLIAKRETKIEVLASRRIESALPRARRHAIRSVFIERFRDQDFDGGLRQGVEAIAVALRDAARDGKLPRAADSIPPLVPKKPESTEKAAKEFGAFRNAGRVPIPIARDRVRLTLEGARLIIDGAEDRAESMNLKANIWVVDDGGHPLAFERMEGGRPASAYTSLTKAVSAATFRQPTGPIPPGAAQPNPILNIGLQNAAAHGGGRITTLFGGVPIVVDGQVIGGVGVGGGTGEQDAKVAQAGIDRFLEAIKAGTRTPRNPTEAAKPSGTPASHPKDETPDAKPGDNGEF